MRLAALVLACVLAARGATCVLTAAGLGGDPEYERRFSTWAQEIERALRASGGDLRLETLSGQAATRERVRAVLERFAGECRRQDDLVLMLIGHGAFDGEEYKFNVPGPDLTGSELAALLEKIPAVRQLVVNMTSASGASLENLRRPNRVVITATRNGWEKNATVFGRHWAEALGDPSADTDKNEAVSALEAFRYAARRTAEFYESQKRLAAEHALLEDTGSGEGSSAPSPESGQGRLAAAFPLVRLGAARAAANDPGKRVLLVKKNELERRIDELKYRKAAMIEAEYRKQLMELLVDLARTQEELEK